MKKTRNLIILILVLVLLIAVYALWRINGTDDNRPVEESANTTTTEESNKLDPLIDLSEDEVDAIQIENSEDKLLLNKKVVKVESTKASTEATKEVKGLPEDEKSKDDQEKDKTEINWVLKDPKYSNISQKKTNNLGSDLLRVAISKEINLDADTNLATYGVKEGNAKVIYKLSNGETKELILGDKAKASNTDQYYAYEPESKRLALISSTAESILSTELDLIETNIFSINTGQVATFLLKRQKDEFDLIVKGELIDTIENNNQVNYNMKWTIVNPITWKGDTTTINNLMQELLSLNAKEFITYEDDSELVKYGLDNPMYEITIKDTSGNSKTLMIGDTANANTYAKLKDSDLIFSFNSSAISVIGTNFMNYFDVFANLVNIIDVGELDFITEDAKYESLVYHPSPEEIENAKDKGYEEPEKIYTLNGRDANVENEQGDNLFTRYYQSLIGMHIAGIDPNPSTSINVDDSEFTVYYKMRTDAEDSKLDFVKRNDDTYYLLINDEYTGAYVDSANFFSKDKPEQPGVLYALEQLEDEMDAQSAKKIDLAEFKEMKKLKPKKEAEKKESE